MKIVKCDSFFLFPYFWGYGNDEHDWKGVSWLYWDFYFGPLEF